MVPQVLFVLGPTAVGKTNLALRVAKNVSAEIINADSVQVYQGLDIGSAKPTSEELKMVTHHFIGHVLMGADYTSGKFRKDVLDLFLKNTCNKYLVVGGSGFYLKGLTHGLYEIPAVPASIQEQVRSMDLSEVFNELSKVDPVSAKKIHPNDSYRLQRALEVYRAFQKPFSSFKEMFHPQENLPFRYKKIGLNLSRELLRERVRLRVDHMVSCGLISEVENILRQGYRDWKALQSVGYKEVISYLDGAYGLDEMKAEIIKNTMGLAKRQMTWFRKDLEVQWFDSESEMHKALDWANEALGLNT